MNTTNMPKLPWLVSQQYSMRFILSQDNEILVRSDATPIEILQKLVDGVNRADELETELAALRAELNKFMDDLFGALGDNGRDVLRPDGTYDSKNSIVASVQDMATELAVSRAEVADLKMEVESGAAWAKEYCDSAVRLDRLNDELRAEADDNYDHLVTMTEERDNLRAEVEELDPGVHSCGEDCPRPACVQRRELAALRAEVAELKEKDANHSEQVLDNLAANDALRAELAAAKEDTANKGEINMNENKFCVDCIHSKEEVRYRGTWLGCKLFFRSKPSMTGVPEYMTNGGYYRNCEYVRAKRGKCGPSAILFEPKR